MSERWLRIRVATQALELLEGTRVLASYAVSTSAKGAGERLGSEQTPRGAHEVIALIGAGEPVGAVFVDRRPTGEICTPEREPVGVPLSHGCIRMRNEDLIALFDALAVGMTVQIDE